MSYPGGKNGAGVYQTIISQMPPHDVYIEPFLGAGAVWRMKRCAPASIVIDRDETVLRSFIAQHGERIAQSSTTVLCDDGIRYLQKRRWDPRDLVYCDPPYLLSSRRQPRAIYRYELEERQHIELLGTLKSLPAMILVSGYPNSLYQAMLPGWRTLTFQTMTRGGKPAIECLWMNFPAPEALHDYRYIGKTFRERERIKRRIERWKSRLLAMPAIERKALAGAIAEIGASRGTSEPAMSAAVNVVSFLELSTNPPMPDPLVVGGDGGLHRANGR